MLHTLLRTLNVFLLLNFTTRMQTSRSSPVRKFLKHLWEESHVGHGELGVWVDGWMAWWMSE